MESDGFKIINKAFNYIYKEQKTTFDELLLEIGEHVSEYGQNRIGEFRNPKCGLAYNSNDIIMFTWALGLMSLEYTLGMLKTKSKDGHCYKHMKPCPDSSAFHQEMIDRCRESIQSLLIKG